MRAELAKPEDLAALMAVYRACLGDPGCTWDDEYPNEDIIAEDIRAGNLFCLRGADGAPYAAACLSAEDDECDAFMSAEICKPCFLCRVVTRKDMRRQGCAKALIGDCLALARARGHDGCMLLVGKRNPVALAMYEKLGFQRRGECRMYDQEWYCCHLPFAAFHHRGAAAEESAQQPENA